MTTKYGFFEEPGFIGLGDTYDKPNTAGETNRTARWGGVGFRTRGGNKTGKLTDATFDKFRPLSQGVPYERPYKERLAMLELSGSTGLGSYEGSIGKAWPHEPEIDHLAKKRGPGGGGIVHEPRNVVSSPGKRGTFGVPGTTVSERHGTGGVAGEYLYAADDYDAYRKKMRDDSLLSIKKRVSEKAFRPPGMPAPHKDPDYIEMGPNPRPQTEKGLTPFRPSHPPRSGAQGAFARFPEYVPDPLALRLKEEKEARDRERQRLGAVPRFVPPNGPKTTATTSILRKNI
eukprot:jgi/Chlat1/6856/Chrsp51S06535